MSEIAERYRKVAAGFGQRAHAVAGDGWDAPAPCDGWVARDIVRHMVEWMPSFFPAGSGVDFGHLPSVDDDPAATWDAFDEALQRALDDPEVAARECETPAGRFSVEHAVDTFCTADVLVHTWDLSRAAGLDERLDPDEVHRLLVEMQPADELLRQSGHYGPKVEVPADADEQTQLIAFTGRQP